MTAGGFLVYPDADPATDRDADGRPTVYTVVTVDGSLIGEIVADDSGGWMPFACIGENGEEHGPTSTFRDAVAWITARQVVVFDAPPEPAATQTEER